MQLDFQNSGLHNGAIAQSFSEGWICLYLGWRRWRQCGLMGGRGRVNWYQVNSGLVVLKGGGWDGGDNECGQILLGTCAMLDTSESITALLWQIGKRERCLFIIYISQKAQRILHKVPPAIRTLSLSQSHIHGEKALHFLQLKPFTQYQSVIPPSTHYCWVDWGGVNSKLAQRFYTWPVLWESNPRPLDLRSNALTTPPRSTKHSLLTSVHWGGAGLSALSSVPGSAPSKRVQTSPSLQRSPSAAETWCKKRCSDE